MSRVSRESDFRLRCGSLLLPALVALAGALAACGSSGTAASDGPSARATGVAITAVLPKDAASEPPWNGRFVQATVRAPSPAAMAADDWSVSVNGEKQELEKPPDINLFASDAATVVFIFKAPFGDLGAYRFRVAYSPPGGPKVVRSWRYEWAP
jgi:hypothetical protein